MTRAFARSIAGPFRPARWSWRTTGRPALAAVQKDRPPVAIMDLGLPPDPDGVTEGFATLEDSAAHRARHQGDRRHRQRRAQQRAEGGRAAAPTISAKSRSSSRCCARSSSAACTCIGWRKRTAGSPRLPARSPIERIVTANQAMLKVCRDIEKLATANVPVLLLGESGTGKEALARGAARAWAARQAAVRRHQLRRDPGEPAGKRAVRPRARRIHRRGQADHRQDRERQPRHAVPRRDRRPAASRFRSSCCASCRIR